MPEKDIATEPVRRFALSGEGAGNVEGLAAKAAPAKKRNFVDEAASKDAEGEADDAKGGGDAKQDVADELHDEIHAALLAGMIIGKEAPELVPDLDEEMGALEDAFFELFEETGEAHDQEADASYAEAGMQLAPSKKNPKVRRWQRVGQVARTAKHVYHKAHGLAAAVHGGTAIGKLATGNVPGAAVSALKAAGHGSTSAGISSLDAAVKKARETKGGRLRKIGAGAKEYVKHENLRGAVPNALGVASAATLAGAPLGAAAALGMGVGGAHVIAGKTIHGIDKLVGHFSKDKRHSHKYWQKKQGWAVKRVAEKTGVSERAAAKTLANLYAHHVAQGHSKGSAHKAALNQALKGESKK